MRAPTVSLMARGAADSKQTVWGADTWQRKQMQSMRSSRFSAPDSLTDGQRGCRTDGVHGDAEWSKQTSKSRSQVRTQQWTVPR